MTTGPSLAELADGPLLETAKLGVLCASGVSAAVAYVLGLWLLRGDPESGQAATLAEAEASTTA